VLDALLRAVAAAGVRLLTEHRVLSIEPADGGFSVATSQGAIVCRQVVLATGGRSLPKTGSDGAGFDFARQLGHTIVATTPALAPLLVEAVDGMAGPRMPSGVSHDVELCVWVDGRATNRLTGALLWTHFGVSGPVVLNASRHWLRATLEGRDVKVTVNMCPPETFDSLERRWAAPGLARPAGAIVSAVSAFVPSSVAADLVDRLSIDPSRTLAQLTRVERRALVHALTGWPLAVAGSRGYNYAEATAAGVALDEVAMATMESRVCAGLYLVGEVLDVDGRLGGFNFQWAWSTAYVAGRALAER
jgi:hypothetical protein